MTHDAIADLERLRTIAEEGRRLPLMGGRHLILWGSVIALATLLHGAVFMQLLPWPSISIAFIWFGLTGLAAILARSGAVMGGEKRLRNDVGNRTERAVWEAGGIFLSTAAISIFAHGYWMLNQQGTTNGFTLFQMMPALTFGVYAVAMRVSAEVAALGSLKPFSWASLAMAGVSILLAGTVFQFPVVAAGVICVSVLPGLKLCALETECRNG